MDVGGYVLIGIVVLGLVFFLIFREEISVAISRVRSIDRSGIAFDTGQREATPERDPRAEAEALLRELDNVLVREIEDNLRNEFRRRNLSGEEALRVVNRYFAATLIALGFEMIYRIIWGSQLGLLQHLNAQPQGQPVEALRPFYVLASSQYPEAYRSYTFEQWLEYLRRSLLIREDGGLLSITVRGREFLTYLTRQGYTFGKAG